MKINEVRKIVGRLRVNLFKRANSFSIGMLKTQFRGTGLQFKEHQVYSFGDDVRFIDWKILAKTNHPYIKTFEEERNIEIVVVLDAGATMYQGAKGVSKLQAAIEICCLMYLLAEETSDFVHTLIVTDKVTNVPKSKGESGLARLISALEDLNILNGNGKVIIQDGQKESVGKDEKYVAIMKHLNKKREVIILSDFHDFLEPELVKKILHRSNVHMFQLKTPLDEAKKIPYLLYSSPGFGASGKFGRFLLGGKKNQADLNKRIRELKVHESYLESFVKEMMR